MNLPQNIGTFLLAIYLILIGLMGLFGVRLGDLSILTPLLALASGACLLLRK